MIPFLKFNGDHFGLDVKRNGGHFGVDLRIILGLGIISGSVSFRGRFEDHFRVGDHFGVGIISGLYSPCKSAKRFRAL